MYNIKKFLKEKNKYLIRYKEFVSTLTQEQIKELTELEKMENKIRKNFY